MANFLFRCDASPLIGVGHFMRCSVLADVLQQRGHQVHLAMRATTALTDERLSQLGLVCHLLRPVSALMDELPAVTELIERQHIDGIVVDHYDAESAYFCCLRQAGVCVGALDDLGVRALHGVDWLLNQNLGADRITHRIDPHCKLLLGLEYCLLRPQFVVERERMLRRFTEGDNRVLLTLGGGDFWPLYESILRSLNAVDRSLRVRMVVPGGLEHQLGDAGLVKLSRHTVEILHNVANMADSMSWADLSINAGGSTCWELCCLGVPMIAQTLSPDQEIVARALHEAGVCRWARAPKEIAGLVNDLLDAPEKRADMSTRAMTLVDGKGAQRAAQSLEDAVARRQSSHGRERC